MTCNQQKKILTRFAILSNMGVFIVTNALKCTPQFSTVSTVLTRIRNTRWFTVFNNLRQMNGHVIVNIQNFAIHHQTPEATLISLCKAF